MADELWSDDEWRAEMSSADINDLPDSDFAYIEPGGTKDDEGKTVPRSLRHFPVHDEAHARNALARASQSPFGDKAMPKILAACKKFGIKVDESKSDATPTESRASHEPFTGTHSHAHPAFGSQGEDDSHEHEHSHDGDADHHHSHEAERSAIPHRSKKPRHRSGPAPMIEFRRFAAEGLEVRSGKAGSDTIEVTGSPVIYDLGYKVRDWAGEFEETMKPGVASDVIARGCDTRFLFNHDGLPLARTLSGTLTLTDTPKKLNFGATLDARQQLANDLAIAIERGDVTQMSCGFIVADDEWDDAMTQRSVYRFSDLLDVSAVTYPASPTTDIAVAQRMMLGVPIESRARIRKMWAITRDLKEGRTPSLAQVELLAEGLKSLAEDDEDRAAPTPQDSKVTAKIKALHQASLDALQAQAGDPDNGADPDDDEVFQHLKNAQSHITKALQAQSKDAAPLVTDDGGTPVQPAIGGEQGDQNAPVPGPSATGDGTGSRSTASLALELEVMRMRKQRRKAS